MGAIKMQDGQNHFEVHYGGRESPFTGGGLDSSNPPAYIAPNAFTTFKNALIADNQITFGNLTAVNAVNFQFSDTAGFCIGMGDLSGVPFEVHFDTGLGAYGTLQVYSYGVGSLNTPTLIGSFALTTATTVGEFTYKNINGICYFSASGLYNIYQHNNVSASVLTSYLGCSFLGELNGRLLALNVAQITYGGNSQNIAGSANQTVTDTVTTAGTVTTNSTAITVATSIAIPSTYINVTLSFAYGYEIIISSGAGMVTINIQYSTNSGATWTTAQTFSTSANAVSYFTQATVNTVSFYVPNIDTIQVQAQLVITGYVNGNYYASCEVGNVFVAVPPVGAATITYSPFQIAWSAALEAYGIFNPLDQNNLVTGAGYNNLPDVEDVISGFFTTGPTGYILRLQGISEMTPLNSGTQPFDFNHLWASHKGIGALYSESVQQYGSVGYFVSDTDIFTIGYDGINVIAGKAKSALYSYINNPDLEIDSAIGTISINNEPFLAYVLAFYNNTSSNIPIVYFIFRADTKEWYQGQLTPFGGLNYSQLNLSLASVELPSLTLGVSSSIVFNCQAEVSGFVQFSTNLYIFANTIQPPNNAADTSVITFNAEEIGFAKMPTIDAIGLYLYSPATYNISNLHFSASVNGITYNTISADQVNSAPILTSSINAGWNYYRLYPNAQSQGYTGITPQLTMSGWFNNGVAIPTAQFRLGKAVLFGTIDPTQRPA